MSELVAGVIGYIFGTVVTLALSIVAIDAVKKKWAVRINLIKKFLQDRLIAFTTHALQEVPQ